MLELICPLCQQPLLSGSRQWVCANGHSYDQARQGYLNLLLVQHKKSRQPGDTPTMLACRQAFLDAGHYQPVSDRIGELLGAAGPHQLLDMGCGEGYYTARLQQQLPECAIGGMDISKDAIIKACRRGREIQWLVGSTARLPVADASLDAALSGKLYVLEGLLRHGKKMAPKERWVVISNFTSTLDLIPHTLVRELRSTVQNYPPRTAILLRTIS